MRAIALIAVLAVSSTQALADMVKDSGSIDAAYVKRDAQSISEGQMLVLSESSGTSANPGGLVDGFAVSIKEVVDLRQGNGSQQGYVIYTKGSERQIVKIDGAVTTVMQDGQPKTTFKGNYTIPPAMGPWASMVRAPIPAISPPKTSSMSIGKARAQSRRTR
jgi:hypothetical protein